MGITGAESWDWGPGVDDKAAAPLARMARVSLVDVSPSMEMQLNDLLVAVLRREERAGGETGASVQRMARRVAILGWIMPAPKIKYH